MRRRAIHTIDEGKVIQAELATKIAEIDSNFAGQGH
jgi:hypothetical protein